MKKILIYLFVFAVGIVIGGVLLNVFWIGVIQDGMNQGWLRVKGEGGRWIGKEKERDAPWTHRGQVMVWPRGRIH